MTRKRKVLLAVLFFCYLAALTWVILFKLLPPDVILAERWSAPVLNLRPFLFDQSSPHLLRTQLREMRGNVLLFIPMGLYLSLLWGKTGWKRTLLTAFGISLAMETIQYGLCIGRADVTDLITNVAGAGLGVVLYALAAKLLGRRTENVLTVTALICTAAVLALLLLILVSNQSM